MEVCADGENDSHIISLMGNSDLHLVDTSMLPSDPRGMMDFVRSADHDDDTISTSFHSTFHSLTNSIHTTFPSSSNMSFSAPPLSSLTCSVSLSASSLASIDRISNPIQINSHERMNSSMQINAPIQISNPSSHSLSHSSSLSQVIVNNLLNPQQRQSNVVLQQLNSMSNPTIPVSHQSPPYQGISPPPLDNRYLQDISSPPSNARYHQELSSPPLDTNRESHVLQKTPSPNQSIMQATPLQIPEFQSYYSNSQMSPPATISKSFQGASGGAFASNIGYAYSTNSLQPLAPVLPNSIFDYTSKRKRSSKPFSILNMKREPEDFSLVSKLQQALSPSGCLGTFEHLNIANEELGESSGGLTVLGQRHDSGDALSVSSLASPLRSPSCNSSIAACTTPSDINHVVNYPQSYVYSSPNSELMLVDSNPNNTSQQNSIPVQIQHEQQTLFHPIHLHNPSGSEQTINIQHADHMNGQPQSHSINLSAYEESLHDDPLNSASRNLSFNYGDILSSNGAQSQQLTYQQVEFSSKMTGKELRRRSSGSNSGRLRENEENLDHFSSDDCDNDSGDDSLVIDTGKKSVEGYECGECKTVCRTRGNLRKHLASEHNTNEPEPCETDLKEYKCPVSGCLYVCKQRDLHDSHVSEHVTQGWTPTGKKRHNKNPLLRHRYNKEEFRCPHCEYSCTVEKAFNRHLSKHANPGSDAYYDSSAFSCVVCGKDRPTEAALRAHMKRHQKGKNVKCDICSFSTVQTKKLIQHRRMHTGEKPHLCPHCTYRAARRDNLRSHVRRMHKRVNMYCDTFTPKQLIKAEAGAGQGVSMLSGLHQQLNQSHPIMTMDQHNPQLSQIPQLQNQQILERMQQQQELMRQNLESRIHTQNMSISSLSPQVIGGGMTGQDPNSLSQGHIILPQQSPHSMMASPPDH